MSQKPEAFERFEKLARAIVRVPKREISSTPSSPTISSGDVAKRGRKRRAPRAKH